MESYSKARLDFTRFPRAADSRSSMLAPPVIRGLRNARNVFHEYRMRAVNSIFPPAGDVCIECRRDSASHLSIVAPSVPSAERRHARNAAPKMKGVGVTGGGRGNNKTGARVRRRFLARPRAPILSPNLSFISMPLSSPPLFPPYFPLFLPFFFPPSLSYPLPTLPRFSNFQRRSIFLSSEIVLSKTIVPRYTYNVRKLQRKWRGEEVRVVVCAR